MGRVLALIIIGILLAAGCASTKVNRFETVAYKQASPENKLKMEQGVIDVGMSIEECRVSCPECQFIKKFTTSSDSYELWETKGDQGRDFYLHVVNGRIEKVSNQIQPHPEKKRKPKLR